MPIYTAKGDIMDFAPSKSEAVAIWMCSGFNSRNSIWRFEIANREIEIELADSSGNLISPAVLKSAYQSDLLNEPWRLNHETLWKIKSKNQCRLKYLYIFPNSDDKSRLNSLKDLDTLIFRGLNVLQKNSIQSVSFILIPSYSSTDTTNNDINDIASANQMIESIKNWLNNNNREMEVYLVDRQDGFNVLL